MEHNFQLGGGGVGWERVQLCTTSKQNAPQGAAAVGLSQGGAKSPQSTSCKEKHSLGTSHRILAAQLVLLTHSNPHAPDLLQPVSNSEKTTKYLTIIESVLRSSVSARDIVK